MAIVTDIQWCDSSANVQMGCEGCELVKGQDKPKCYAKTLTDRWAGTNKGWPLSFEQPRIFMDRVPKMLSWNDLSGQLRQNKPWLDGMPRLIFLNDMGDTFSKGMPADWFAEVIELIRESKHQFLVLTKWPERFVYFSSRFDLPHNIWPGTSVTSDKTIFRAKQIASVNTRSVKWLSVEPLWSEVYFGNRLDDIDWVIIGGESGRTPTPCKIEWIEFIIAECKYRNIPVFVKQLGSFLSAEMKLKDGHGGDMSEWPEHLRVRQMPLLHGPLFKGKGFSLNNKVTSFPLNTHYRTIKQNHFLLNQAKGNSLHIHVNTTKK